MSSATESGRAIRVLLVDDSKLTLRFLRECLKDDPMLEVVGVASNGQTALDCLSSLRPDVMTLDIQMPVMGGLEALQRLKKCERPPRVLILSDFSDKGARCTIEALGQGAADFVLKPTPSNLDFEAFRADLTEKIKAIARVERAGRPGNAGLTTRRAVLPGSVIDFVGIGVSTGGPQALDALFRKLPGDFPAPIVVVQHMPASFTASLASALDEVSALRVCEAAEGQLIRPGEAVIAQGGRHLVPHLGDRGVSCRLSDAEAVRGCRPSVDVLFSSMAATFRARSLAVIMTGMGQDGLDGARLLRAEGATIFTQDEASSVVFGMPGAVIREGLQDATFSLDRLPDEITRVARTGHS